jgi:uncharacterized protein YPO0396
MAKDDKAVMSMSAVQLLADCMTANEMELAWAKDQVIKGLEQQVRQFAVALVDLHRGIERIPAMIRSSYLDELLDRREYDVERALAFLTQNSCGDTDEP